MMLNASHDYALRMCRYLAETACASSREISEATGAPRCYMIQLAQRLREAGIVYDHPGKHGGYSLAKCPEDVTVLDVVRAVDGDTGRLGRATAYAEWRVIDVLDSITLMEAM